VTNRGERQLFDDADEAAEAAISPRTRAILVVHQIGLPADIARFLFYVFVVIFLVLLVLGLTIFRV